MGSYSDVVVKTSPKEEEDEAVINAMLFSTSQMFPSMLNAAIELNLFQIIAKANAAISVSEIASKVPTQHLDRLQRMLRFLANYSLLTCSTHTNDHGITERTYGLSSVGKYFVSDETRGCFDSFTTLCLHPIALKLWPNFKDVMIDSEDDLCKRVHGMTFYQCNERDPQLNYIFNKSMADICNIEMNRILEGYKGFEGVSNLVDVGGCTGQTLHMIVSKYSTIKGINFDLPQVVEKAPSYPGIEHVGGDMYHYVPKGDAMILKSVLHNWSDEQCLSILRNCHNALPQNGKVIVIEFIAPEEASDSNVSKLISNLDSLMYVTSGGRERSEKEYEELCKLSGFSRFQVVFRAFSALGTMEFHK